MLLRRCLPAQRVSRRIVQSRFMSSSQLAASQWQGSPPTEAKTFIAVIYDKTDSKRLSVRPQHLANAAEAHSKGWLEVGGAMLSEPDASNEQKMIGSFMIYKATDLAHARELIMQDIYTTGGAWDPERMTIHEARVAKH